MVDVDFIQGERFMRIADSTYALKDKLPDDYYNLVNTINWGELKDINVIYTHTMYVSQLFDIIKHFKQKFIIITHNSDCRIEEQGIVTPNGRSEVGSIDPCSVPDNVIRWYSTNVNVINPKIISIPIGMENNRWQGNPRKQDRMVEKLKQPRKYKNLLYINHSIGTNVTQRAEPYQLLEGKSWVTSEERQDFDIYIDNIYNHKFVICPEGNGMDTHRTWECLYMGTIPIEKRNLNNRFYEDLPICFVDDWKEITKSFLEKEYKRIKNSAWTLDKLNFNWYQKIIKECQPLSLIEENLAARIEKGKVLIQIGTNNAYDEFNSIAKYAEAKKVILVEPDRRYNVTILDRYAGVDNVFIENVAITEINKGLVKLVTPRNNVNCYSLLPMDDWGDDFLSIEVPSMTFNELCEKHKVTDVHYLQIDTEGYDVEILKAIDFKKINIDIIKYENWGFPEDHFTRYGDKAKLYGVNGVRDAVTLLEDLGYEVRTDWGNADSVAVKH